MIFKNTSYNIAIYFDPGKKRDVLQKPFFEEQNLFTCTFAANKTILENNLKEIDEYQGIAN